MRRVVRGRPSGQVKRKRLYMLEYYKKNRKKIGTIMRKHMRRPEVVARESRRRRTPATKRRHLAYMRAYNRMLKTREAKKRYAQRPESRMRQKEYMRRYKTKKPSVDG